MSLLGAFFGDKSRMIRPEEALPGRVSIDGNARSNDQANPASIVAPLSNENDLASCPTAGIPSTSASRNVFTRSNHHVERSSFYAG